MEDLQEFLTGAGMNLRRVAGEDTLGIDQLQKLRDDWRVRELQERRPQQGPAGSTPRKRKQGGDRKAKDARRRARQVRAVPPSVLPPPRPEVLYRDGKGKVISFTRDIIRVVAPGKPKGQGTSQKGPRPYGGLGPPIPPLSSFKKLERAKKVMRIQVRNRNRNLGQSGPDLGPASGSGQ